LEKPIEKIILLQYVKLSRKTNIVMDSASAEIVQDNTGIIQERAVGARARIAAFFELTKPRIAFLLVLTAAAGFYVGSPGRLEFLRFVNTLIGIALLAFGVSTLNQYIERVTDALMKRTAARPLPTNRVTPTEALVFGVVQCALAEFYLLLLTNATTAVMGLVVIVGYVFLYTPLKRKTSASTAIGAIPGAMPPLMGWVAASNDVTLGAWALFAILFLWQFPHFLAIAWMYREDYAKAGILMLPVLEPDGRVTVRQIVLFTLMLVPVSLAPFFLGFAGVFYLAGATVLGIWFLVASIRLARGKTIEQARRVLVVSVLYLPLLFGLLVLGH
jgi:heme o synthase